MAPSSSGAAAPALAVSTVIFTLRTCETGEMKLALALVKRIRKPFDSLWALPGGPLNITEDLSAAAAHFPRPFILAVALLCGINDKSLSLECSLSWDSQLASTSATSRADW